MQVEIITIGDEILIGQIVDTNSAWIAERFASEGLNISRIVSVSDRSQEIETAITDAMSRTQVVITTGGLGPTKDDITKHTIAKMFGVELVRDEQVFEHVRAMTERRGFDFNTSNQSQALVPSGCTVIHNANGTAPGMLIRRDGRLLFSLAGVPFEMKSLIEDQVLPILRSEFNLRPSIHRTIVLFGIAESSLSELIAPWEDAIPEHLHLAYLPSLRGIRLRLSAYSVDGNGVREQIDEHFSELRKLIEPYYIGPDPMSVEGAIAELLVASGKTLAVAESCTGGMISSRITALEGASKYYLGGVTSYSNEVKSTLLGVAQASIKMHGAVSQQVAEQMAQGVRFITESDYSIATTGIAGPSGGSDDKPVGTVWIAIAWEGGVASRLLHFGAQREQNIERASTQALNMLRLHLLKP